MSRTTTQSDDDVTVGAVMLEAELRRLRYEDAAVAEFVAAGGLFRPLSASSLALPSSMSPSP